MIERWIKELESLAAWDELDEAHERADHILCVALIYLGYSRLTQAYHDVQPKRY